MTCWGGAAAQTRVFMAAYANMDAAYTNCQARDHGEGRWERGARHGK